MTEAIPGPPAIPPKAQSLDALPHSRTASLFGMYSPQPLHLNACIAAQSLKLVY